MHQTAQRIVPSILYSCHPSLSRQGEQFIPEHIFGYMLSGSLEVFDGKRTYVFNEGDFRLARKNHLIKFVKVPPANGEFKSMSVVFTRELLQSVSLEYGYKSASKVPDAPYAPLNKNLFFKNYFESLLPYLGLSGPENDAIINHKTKEGLLLLLKERPDYADILFDFAEPGKIDLQAFMHQNYHYNVEISRFAYLTGRSLNTFKRDFAKIFNTSPNKWLQERRLNEALYLMKEKGQRPSDVYLEVGFENFSHFSRSFKKFFGFNASNV